MAKESPTLSMAQLRAEREKQEAAYRKQKQDLQDEGKRQILAMAASLDIDLARLARETRVYREHEYGKIWPGTGRMPAWLKRKLEAGHKLEEFEVKRDEAMNEHERRPKPDPAAG